MRVADNLPDGREVGAASEAVYHARAAVGAMREDWIIAYMALVLIGEIREELREIRRNTSTTL